MLYGLNIDFKFDEMNGNIFFEINNYKIYVCILLELLISLIFKNVR